MQTIKLTQRAIMQAIYHMIIKPTQTIGIQVTDNVMSLVEPDIELICLTYDDLLNYLRKSCELHKCDDNAAVFVTEKDGVLTAQYFESDTKDGNDKYIIPQVVAMGK